jgi:hypothetical protein
VTRRACLRLAPRAPVNGKPLDVPRHCDVTAFEGEGFNFGPEEATSSWSFRGAGISQPRARRAVASVPLTPQSLPRSRSQFSEELNPPTIRVIPSSYAVGVGERAGVNLDS